MNIVGRIGFIVVAGLMMSACSQSRIIVQPDPQFAPVDIKAAEFQPAPNGSIFQSGRSVRLFEDSKAFRVGDILSVTLQESTNASKSAATSTSKSDDVGTSAGVIFGGGTNSDNNDLFSNTLSADRSFDGSGDSSQSNSLNGEIAVTVADILPNGNLLIRGEKIIGLNQGSEFIRLAGIVRPQDVSSGNIVTSTKIANARIFYGGGGVVGEANARGWLTRFFDSPMFPL